MLLKRSPMTDALVTSAIAHWAQRFVANGVDVNDFQRVTNSIERWDDWCQKWSECGAMHEHMGEQAEAQGHYTSAASHYLHAAISYHFGKYLFVHRDGNHVCNNIPYKHRPQQADWMYQKLSS